MHCMKLTIGSPALKCAGSDGKKNISVWLLRQVELVPRKNGDEVRKEVIESTHY